MPYIIETPNQTYAADTLRNARKIAAQYIGFLMAVQAIRIQGGRYGPVHVQPATWDLIVADAGIDPTSQAYSRAEIIASFNAFNAPPIPDEAFTGRLARPDHLPRPE